MPSCRLSRRTVLLREADGYRFQTLLQEIAASYPFR